MYAPPSLCAVCPALRAVSLQRLADEAINLVFRFDTLDSGSSVSFTWAYMVGTVPPKVCLTWQPPKFHFLCPCVPFAPA